MRLKRLAPLAALMLAAPAMAQPAATAQSHADAARKAAGSDFQGVYAATCTAQFGPTGGAAANSVPTNQAAAANRAAWYAPPHKVFDNLYWVGEKEHSAWALTTTDGIILIDTLYNYAVEPEIVDGLKTLGLDPAKVKYVIVSHGHGDHDQGARLFQDRYGSHVVMGAADWDGVGRTPNMPGGAPKRDMVISGVQKLTLGDETVTIVPTPGHTPGTLSLIFPVKNGGRTLTVAYSGGTAFNFAHTPERFDTYIASQQAFQKAAADARATIVLSNHSAFDHALDKAAASTPGKTSPFEVGQSGVQRYLKTLEECALATRMKEFGR